jgi:hypothetical protein
VSYAMGVSLCAFYILPILFEGSKYTLVHNIFNGLNGVAFQKFNEYIYSPWKGGFLFQGPKGQLSFILGYAHWLVVILSLPLLLLNKVSKNNIVLLTYSLISFFIIFFMMMPFSIPIWNAIPLIKYSQNSYRLLVILIFLTSTSAGIILSKSNKFVVILILILVIITTSLNWGNRRNIPTISTDNYFENAIPYFQSHPGGSDYDLPIWVNPITTPFRKIPSHRLEFLKGKGEARELSRKTTVHTYVLNAQTGVEMRENTFFFPGWNIYANGKQIQINHKNTTVPGILTFSLPKGLYLIEVKYKNTNIRNLGDFISISTLTIIILLILFSFFKKLHLTN